MQGDDRVKRQDYSVSRYVLAVCRDANSSLIDLQQDKAGTISDTLVLSLLTYGMSVKYYH